MSEIQDEHLFLFRVPSDLSMYEFEYGFSEFIECDCKLARNKLSPTYQQNFTKNFHVLSFLSYVSNYLISIQKHYTIFSGTLIGWYRDCGVIPYTTDMDMVLSHDEYEAKIKKHFIGDKVGHLSIVYGMRNSSYELRLEDSHHMVDLFIAYRINETHQVTGYFVERDLYV